MGGLIENWKNVGLAGGLLLSTLFSLSDIQ